MEREKDSTGNTSMDAESQTSKTGPEKEKSKNYRQGQQGFVLTGKLLAKNQNSRKNSSCTTQYGDETMFVTRKSHL